MNTKMIVTRGYDTDRPSSSQTSGLVQAIKILKGVKGISFIELNKKDIVRHKLVTRIVEAYEKFEEKTKSLKKYRQTFSPITGVVSKENIFITKYRKKMSKSFN